MLGGEPARAGTSSLLNAGAALEVAGERAASPDGIQLAAGAIDSGAAAQTPRALAAVSNADRPSTR